MFFRMSILVFLSLSLSACSDDGSPFNGDGTVVLKGSPRSMALNGGDIFFANESGGRPVISMLSTAGGGTTQVAGPLNAKVTQVVADGEWIAWVESEDTSGVIYHMRLSEPVPQRFLDSLENPVIALSDGILYAAGVSGEAGGISSLPLAGGDPTSMAADVGAVRAMAADDQYLYIAQAYDAPNGRIVRMPLSAGPHTPETLVGGLGTPLAILLTDDSVCWREFQGGLLQCASKADGTPRLLGANFGFLAVSSPKFVADDTSIFFATNSEIQRVALAGGTAQLVARLPSLSFVHALILVEDTLYFSDGSALRSIDKNNVIASDTTTSNNLPAGPGCPSPFDGKYIGQFEYEYEAGDPANPPLTTVQDAVQVTVDLECITDFQGMATLNVTHVIASHPYFGCQIGGCTPISPSVAILPSELPVSTGSPSGSGLVIMFPNGTNLGTTNGVGALRISSDGRTISNSLDPTYENSTWLPCCDAFPPDAQGVVRYKSWILTKSAL